MNKTLITLLFTIIVSLAYGQEVTDSIEYDYITLTVDKRKPNDVFISHSNGEYEKRKIESSGKFDYSGVLKIVNEKEKQGFVLFSNSFATFGGDSFAPHNYFILRKRRTDANKTYSLWRVNGLPASLLAGRRESASLRQAQCGAKPPQAI